MSDLREDLTQEFQDEEYRYAYAESFLNTRLAAQIKTLREQRGETQAQVASRMGISQPGYRRFEDVNHSVWKTDSLWDIAKAYGVRVSISFETFGALLDDKKNFSKKNLRRHAFKDDPAFKGKDGASNNTQLAERINAHRDVPQAEAVNATPGANIAAGIQAASEALNGDSGPTKVLKMPKQEKKKPYGRSGRTSTTRNRTRRRVRGFLLKQRAV